MFELLDIQVMSFNNSLHTIGHPRVYDHNVQIGLTCEDFMMLHNGILKVIIIKDSDSFYGLKFKIFKITQKIHFIDHQTASFY